MKLLTSRIWALLLCGVAAANLAFSCGEEDPVMENSDFSRWCGHSPCGWDLLEGAVEQVPTWHKRDYGVGFVGERVILAQTVSWQSSCLCFEIQGDWDSEVSLFLALDFLSDGDVEYARKWSKKDWERESFCVKGPTWFSDVTVRLHKQGDGEAVVARLAEDEGESCSGDPLPLDDRPPGASCDYNWECSSNRCWDGTCLWPLEETQGR